MMPDVLAPAGADGEVALQQLSVAEDGVQRRAQLVADADDEPGFREVGRLGHLLGLLQLRVGAPVRGDLGQQEVGLAADLLLRHAAAFPHQRQQPGEHAA